MNQIINFEISNYCNLKCPLCSREVSTDKHPNLITEINNVQIEYEIFEEIVFSNYSYFKNCVCKFCGEYGDPLTHKQIDDFIELSSKCFKDVLIFTNGSIKKSSWYKHQMQKNSNLHLHFGIDGTTNDVNNLYRTGSNIKKVFNNLRSATEIDSNRVHWDFTIFKWNEHQVDDAQKIAKTLNVDINIRPNGKPNPEIEKEINDRAKNLLQIL